MNEIQFSGNTPKTVKHPLLDMTSFLSNRVMFQAFSHPKSIITSDQHLSRFAEFPFLVKSLPEGPEIYSPWNRINDHKELSSLLNEVKSKTFIVSDVPSVHSQGFVFYVAADFLIFQKGEKVVFFPHDNSSEFTASHLSQDVVLRVVMNSVGGYYIENIFPRSHSEFQEIPFLNTTFSDLWENNELFNDFIEGYKSGMAFSGHGFSSPFQGFPLFYITPVYKIGNPKLFGTFLGLKLQEQISQLPNLVKKGPISNSLGLLQPYINLHNSIVKSVKEPELRKQHLIDFLTTLLSFVDKYQNTSVYDWIKTAYSFFFELPKPSQSQSLETIDGTFKVVPEMVSCGNTQFRILDGDIGDQWATYRFQSYGFHAKNHFTIGNNTNTKECVMGESYMELNVRVTPSSIAKWHPDFSKYLEKIQAISYSHKSFAGTHAKYATLLQGEEGFMSKETGDLILPYEPIFQKVSFS